MDENIILLEGIRRKLQAGADPRELSSMFKHALSPENRFDFFESIAGICGVNVIRLLNVRSDEEEVTWPPEDEWKTSQQEYTERPQFKRMPVQDPENEIEAFIYLHHKNPYEVLGISPEGCDADTLKQAYRKMMLKYHPDKCKDQSIATSMSQILNGAYSALFSHHQKPKGDEALVKEKTRQILILA